VGVVFYNTVVLETHPESPPPTMGSSFGRPNGGLEKLPKVEKSLQTLSVLAKIGIVSLLMPAHLPFDRDVAAIRDQVPAVARVSYSSSRYPARFSLVHFK
jgi:hypothetical protein